MNFTSTVKNEIINKKINNNFCKKSFLAGFIRATGSIIKKNGEYGFEFSSESTDTVNYIKTLMKDAFLYEMSSFSTEEDKLNKKERITYECVGKEALAILDELNIFKFNGTDYQVNLKLDSELLKTDEEKRAFIRGAFVGSGNITVPNKYTDNKIATTGYHLEFVFFSYQPALEFTELLASFNILTKLTERKENFIIYIKSSEEIKDFLALINAPKSVLKLTDLIIEKEIFNNANRQKNCDLANVTKQVNAAEKQISAIKFIDETIGLNSLNSQLKITAETRLANSEDTLSELAEKLDITKSCLNHRLRKLLEIEKNLKN